MTDTAVFSRRFDGLEVGARFATRGRTVTESDLVSFSALTGDWHPQHANAAWAASSQFGERIAHGMLVVSYALGQIGFHPERVLALRRLTKVTFKRPVRIGDTISVDGKIAGLRPLDSETGLATCSMSICNQDGAVVVRVELEVLWRRDVAEPATDREAYMGTQGEAPPTILAPV
jgi:acyl dehydratase